MSEQGWRAFLAAEGVEDWVVLHGGATAVFRTDSLVRSAALAQAIAGASRAEGAELLLTLGVDRVSVRLTRGVFRLEEGHIPIARAISGIARQHGAVPDRAAVQEVQLAMAAHLDEVDPDFWRTVLGYVPLAEDNAVDPNGHGSTTWMQEIDPTKPLRHAMHVDVSVAREYVLSRVTAAIAAGGRVVDESSAPGFFVLADRAGNKVCVAAWPDGAAEA